MENPNRYKTTKELRYKFLIYKLSFYNWKTTTISSNDLEVSLPNSLDNHKFDPNI